MKKKLESLIKERHAFNLKLLDIKNPENEIK